MSWAFLKALYDSKILGHAPGLAAMIVVAYVYLFQITPLQAQVADLTEDVKAMRQAQLEERLDATYAALCMNPGDPAVLERIRELQQEYESVAQRRYNPPACSLLMKIR